MKNLQKNLVIVDYQYDFVALDGNLTCGQSAINIENAILSLVDSYKNENIFVTYDTHYETDWNEDQKTAEAKTYPMHCVFQTKGHDLFGGLEEKLKDVKHEKIYKASFATEKLARKIIEKNDPNEPLEIKFCGVSTNVCVMQNVILIYNYLAQNNIDFKIVIDRNTVASFDDELGEQSLNYMRDILGVEIV